MWELVCVIHSGHVKAEQEREAEQLAGYQHSGEVTPARRPERPGEQRAGDPAQPVHEQPGERGCNRLRLHLAFASAGHGGGPELLAAAPACQPAAARATASATARTWSFVMPG